MKTFAAAVQFEIGDKVSYINEDPTEDGKRVFIVVGYYIVEENIRYVCNYLGTQDIVSGLEIELHTL